MSSKKKRPHGHRNYGVEDSSGNILLPPRVTGMAAAYEAAAKLADARGDRVYLFEVGGRPHTIVSRQEVAPLRPGTSPGKALPRSRREIVEAMVAPWTEESSRPRKRTVAQIDREIVEALASGRRSHATMRSQAAYRVAYLVPNPRRGEPGQETMLQLWYAGADVLQTMAEAMADLRAAKRRGYTAWVVDAAGRHVPVKGAARPYPGRYST